ncbi:hypothetical protein [Halomonas casei]|uniref:hypothetical protein n=1 Tax=Halomonas casei TaxID=2742613 RepID=UPI003CF77C17
MHAIEFETEIQNGIVKIPDKYGYLKNRNARIVVLYENTPEETAIASAYEQNEAKQRVGQQADEQRGLDFALIKAPSLSSQQGVEYQRRLRDEW